MPYTVTVDSSAASFVHDTAEDAIMKAVELMSEEIWDVTSARFSRIIARLVRDPFELVGVELSDRDWINSSELLGILQHDRFKRRR